MSRIAMAIDSVLKYGLGADGTRDPEFPCRDYKKGEPDWQAVCETDGHYLCAGCRWNEHRKEGKAV